MKFDVTSDNIILISYTSGGFGNFLYHVLSEFADETVKVVNQFKFSSTGDSHATKKYTERYFQDQPYTPNILVDPADKKILILGDHGINYNSIVQTFPNAKIVRSVVNTDVYSVVHQTCVEKGMLSNILEESMPYVTDNWAEGAEDYAVRENFTLLYHNWPDRGWSDSINLKNIINLNIENLINNPSETIIELIKQLGLTPIKIDALLALCKDWLYVNKKYFHLYFKCVDIFSSSEVKPNIDLTEFTSLHDQGYINYRIEKKFNIVIPVYDYRNWFNSTNDIAEMVHKLK